jgi:BASS family bile acid:Na+ symporter
MIQPPLLQELVNLNSPAFQNLARITVFTLMLTIGTRITLKELASLWQRPRWVVRSLLAVVVAVPLTVVLALSLLELPQAVGISLIALAAAPGAPLTTRRSGMAGGEFPFTAGLQVTLGLLAVLVAPLLLAIFKANFSSDPLVAEPLEIARQVAIVQLLPIGVGLAIRRFSAPLADELDEFLPAIANVLFLVLALSLLVIGLHLVPQLSILSIVTLAGLAASSLAIGHLLGGPEQTLRAAVAIACIARNVGLALFILTLSHAEDAVPVLIAYLLIGFVVALPYSVWSKRTIAKLL